MNKLLTGAIGFVAVLALIFSLQDNPSQVVERVQNIGAVASPDIPSPWIRFGGVQTFNYRDVMDQASTTCSFVSPASTSTLLFAGARVSSSTSATHSLEWGKAITAFATSTSFGEVRSLAAGSQYTVLASTTIDSQVDGKVVFAPNTYLNLKVSTSTVSSGTTTFGTPVGTCYATFVTLP